PTAKDVLELFHGRCPRSIDKIHRLPVIRKNTAHSIASIAFDQPVPIIEANTARVLVRILNFRRPMDRRGGREKLWEHAATLVPERSARIYNSALTDLGALVCRPRRPRC